MLTCTFILMSNIFYILTCHYDYVTIQFMLTYNLQCMLTCNLCWHTTYVHMQLMLTHNLCWHTIYVDIQLLMTCNLNVDMQLTFVSRCNQHLCWHVTYVDIWLMLMWLLSTCIIYLHGTYSLPQLFIFM